MALKYDRFMIAPSGFTIGLETDKKPWIIPDEAFAELNNAYVFRGRVRKRFGSYLMGSGNPNNSRLRVQVGTTDGSGDISDTVPGSVFAIGQQFSIGLQVFTVYQTGTPAVMLISGSATGATYDTSNGNFVITGAALNSPVYFYPALPVMGLTNYEVGPVNDQPSYAFDTQFAYKYAGGGWQRSVSFGEPVFKGTDDQFFWATNWTGLTADSTVLFVTNFNATIGAPGVNDDIMWYFDGTTWFDFTPITIFLTTGDFVQTARIILPFKNRLLLLNTIEFNTNTGENQSFINRCRFSHIGSPISTNAWLEPNQTTGGQNADGAGFIDAATEEAIVSAEFIKDRLIVYFERSTWELAFTNNNLSPFLWQKINTELGSEATFSTVPFDKVVLTIGNTGVHACSGANVERIDDKIPQRVFSIVDKSEGVARVAGIRDYFNEMVYWTFPSDNRASSAKFPNKILVFNYQNSSWAFNDDSITTWGYFEQQDDVTWNSTDWIWEETTNDWVSGVIEANFRQVIAGNQEGFVFVVSSEISRNAAALQITNIVGDTLTVINHNLEIGSYVLVENAVGSTEWNGRIFQVESLVDANTITFDEPITNVYLGGGTLARVSNIQILSKQWNPYVNSGKNVYIYKMDFLVDKTDSGEVTVDYYPSSTELSMIAQGQATQSIMGTGVLETSPYALVPLEQVQTRLWHSVYFQADGESIQINVSMSAPQMLDKDISLEDFELHGIILYCQPISRLQ